jgi:hypothetical protein
VDVAKTITGARMSFETPQRGDETLKMLTELQWQREMIERWVYCAGITADALEQIKKVLSDVDREVQALKDKRYMD